MWASGRDRRSKVAGGGCNDGRGGERHRGTGCGWTGPSRRPRPRRGGGGRSWGGVGGGWKRCGDTWYCGSSPQPRRGHISDLQERECEMTRRSYAIYTNRIPSARIFHVEPHTFLLSFIIKYSSLNEFLGRVDAHQHWMPSPCQHGRQMSGISVGQMVHSLLAAILVQNIVSNQVTGDDLVRESRPGSCRSQVSSLRKPVERCHVRKLRGRALLPFYVHLRSEGLSGGGSA